MLRRAEWTDYLLASWPLVKERRLFSTSCTIHPPVNYMYEWHVGCAPTPTPSNPLPMSPDNLEGSAALKGGLRCAVLPAAMPRHTIHAGHCGIARNHQTLQSSHLRPFPCTYTGAGVSSNSRPECSTDITIAASTATRRVSADPRRQYQCPPSHPMFGGPKSQSTEHYTTRLAAASPIHLRGRGRGCGLTNYTGYLVNRLGSRRRRHWTVGARGTLPDPGRGLTWAEGSALSPCSLSLYLVS